jgi:signal recognition particle subunit SEC65
VAKAARSLGLKVTVLEDARHPARWHEPKAGCVLVEKGSEPKEAVLRQVANRL